MGKPRRPGTTARHGWIARRLVPTCAFAIALAGAAPVLGQTPQPTCFGLPATIVGTPGDDEGNAALVGTPGDDVIVGLAGDDEIDGLGGNDRICGEAGEDTLSGSEGDDSIDGGSEFDWVRAGLGNDVLTGGEDLDALTFERAPQRVEVLIRTGTAVGAGSVRFSEFEAVLGSAFDDLLVGDDTANFFFGLGGNDVIRGEGGFDSVLFDRPVIANLSAGPGAGRGVADGEGHDTLESIEGLGGSDGEDVLVGDANNNLFLGFDARDQVAGRGGRDRLLGNDGPDRLDGGEGNDTMGGGEGDDNLAGGSGADDTITYEEAPSAVRADLTSGTVRGEGVDTVSGVEAVSGSEFADTLAGNGRSNSLAGNGGPDRLLGRASGDFLDGGSGRDDADGGAGHDFCVESERMKRCEPSRRLSAFGGISAVTNGAGLAAAQLGRIHRAARRGDRSLSPDFLRSLSPLATLRHLAAPQDAVKYSGGTAPTCRSSGGRNVITISPPERVKALSSQDERVIWNATLRRYSGRGPGTIVIAAPTAEAKIEAGLTQAGWPEWNDGRYQPIVTAVRPGTYSWVARVTWDYSGSPLPSRRVRPHRQAGRLGDSCTFR